MSQALHVTTETFETEVLNSDVPVLIDFYATWCGPCRMMGPILDRVAAQTAGRAKIVKIDVDESPELAAEFQVSSIPALVVVHRGSVAASLVGVRSAESLVSLLNNVANSATV